MSKEIRVPSRDQLTEKSQTILGQIEQKLGMVPNLYATLGYADNALESFLEFSGRAGAGSFSNKEIEAIKLAVSEVNQCQYCLAAHTALAKMAGFSEDETLAIRGGSALDAKINVLSRAAAELARKRGKLSIEVRNEFFEQGFQEKDLIELISVVTSITFTNYLHGSTEIPIDFPRAKTLEFAEV